MKREVKVFERRKRPIENQKDKEYKKKKEHTDSAQGKRPQKVI